MEIRLDGKGALVTGASRGIGRAIALGLARAGADVAVNYHRSVAEAQKVFEEIRRMGRQSITIPADVGNSHQVDMMVDKVGETFQGRIDILVNNAGIYPFKEVVNMTNGEWSHLLDTNLNSAFYTARAVAKKMIQRGLGGRMINISSGAGHSGRHGKAHYCASKAGLILLSKTLSIELAPYGINVNSISVGFVDVGQYDSPDLEPMKKDILRRILLRRPGRPEEIAHVAVFLASEQASWITGADFCVDGGESAGRIPEPNIEEI